LLNHSYKTMANCSRPSGPPLLSLRESRSIPHFYPPTPSSNLIRVISNTGTSLWSVFSPPPFNSGSLEILAESCLYPHRISGIDLRWSVLGRRR
jgi:hypothetical protein